MKYFVLVTGASSGIGEAACKTLVENKYEVLAGVRNTADGDRLESIYGGRIHSLVFDVVDELSIKQAKDKAKEIIGNDALIAIVNNAGIVVAGAFLYVPIEKWRYQLDVNVLGVIRTTQIFFDLLKNEPAVPNRHPRRIINISSVSGLFASPFIGAYAASKFALEALSDSLRRELYMYDIQVVLIEPGNIITPIWNKAKTSEYYSGPEYDSITAYKEKLIDDNIRQGLKAEIVADRILKSVRNKEVKLRYLIRAKAWKFRLIQIVPVRWVDKLIRKKLKSNSGIRPF